MRRLLLVALAAALLLGAGAVVGLKRLRAGPDLPGGEVALSGLSAPVEVRWDSLGVPHVRAESVHDAVSVQGWLHARHRLWQMDLFGRVLDGRLSELFGERTLTSDRFLRTVGLGRAADETAAGLDPETRGVLEAYAAGVNAAVDGWKGPLPPEFVLLRTRPEPWSVRRVVGMEKIMAWDLAEYGESLSLAMARRALDDEAWDHVRPRYPDWGPVIVEGADRSAGALERAPVPSPSLPVDTGLLARARIPAPARSFLARASVVRASNAWVVGGERSRSGRPIVANDMHLGLDAPTLWYLIALHAPGLHVVGMSLPGAPGVVAGRTRGVAWGFTNGSVDDSDFFVERVDSADPSRYLTPGGSALFGVRTEVIRVRGGDDDTLRVRSTRHGPVITPVEPRAGAELLAFRWVGHEPSTTAAAILEMNRSSTVDGFLRGLSRFSNPHQNVVFADTAGSFGYWLAGRVPLRADGDVPLLPVPGWTGEHDWVEWLPFEENPHVVDPDRGYVVTANNRQSRDSVSVLASGGSWAPPYRAQRIEERIRARRVHDVSSMAEIQLDVESAFATRYRSRAVDAFRGAGLETAAAALEGWDLRATRESREAALFYAWIEETRAGLRRHLYGEATGYLPLRAVERLLEGRVAEAGEIPGAAASRALDGVGGRSWGEVHRLVLDHPLASTPVLGRLLGFGRGPVPREGAHFTVNVASFPATSPPFITTSGPSQRHVSDLADPAGAGHFVLPGGQSGWPAGPHSWDQLRLWLGGELVPLRLEPRGRSHEDGKGFVLRPLLSRP